MENKRYLKHFISQEEYESQKDEVLGRPSVALVDDNVKYDIPSINLTIGTYGVTTFYYDYPVSIPQGVSAYIIDGIQENDGKIKTSGKEIYGSIPPHTGVILGLKDGIEPTTFKMLYNPNNLADVSGNLLKGTVDETCIEGPAYILSVVDGVIGFYRVKLNYDANGNEGNTHFLNKAYKVYLKK